MADIFDLQMLPADDDGTFVMICIWIHRFFLRRRLVRHLCFTALIYSLICIVVFIARPVNCELRSDFERDHSSSRVPQIGREAIAHLELSNSTLHQIARSYQNVYCQTYGFADNLLNVQQRNDVNTALEHLIFDHKNVPCPQGHMRPTDAFRLTPFATRYLSETLHEVLNFTKTSAKKTGNHATLFAEMLRESDLVAIEREVSAKDKLWKSWFAVDEAFAARCSLRLQLMPKAPVITLNSRHLLRPLDWLRQLSILAGVQSRADFVNGMVHRLTRLAHKVYTHIEAMHRISKEGEECISVVRKCKGTVAVASFAKSDPWLTPWNPGVHNEVFAADFFGDLSWDMEAVCRLLNTNLTLLALPTHTYPLVSPLPDGGMFNAWFEILLMLKGRKMNISGDHRVKKLSGLSGG